MLEIEVKRKNTSKLLSNKLIMFSGLAIISIMFILINFIIASTKKVSIILAYKLQDLCTSYSQCHVPFLLVFIIVLKFLGILLTNTCKLFFSIYTVHK